MSQRVILQFEVLKPKAESSSLALRSGRIFHPKGPQASLWGQAPVYPLRVRLLADSEDERRGSCDVPAKAERYPFNETIDVSIGREADVDGRTWLPDRLWVRR